MRYRRLLALALIALIAWLYSAILARLFAQWINDPNFSHGIFVPAFTLLVLWRDRTKLKAIGPAPSWAGLPLISLALFILILGVLGSEVFLSRVSLLLLLAGLVILFQGKTFFRAVLFPWAFLFLMIPIPVIVIQKVTDPLQLLAAKLASTMLYLVGVPVSRQGNVIDLPPMKLDVVHVSSGIRSILTLLTVAIIYGYLVDKRKWVRVALACSAVPIAVAANSLRIFGVGFVAQYWDPAVAEEYFRIFEGWVIFVASLIMLFILHRLISLIWKSTRQTTSPVPIPAITGSSVNNKAWLFRFGTATALLLVAAILIQARSHTEHLPPRDPLSSLPTQIDGWAGQDIKLDQRTLDILKPNEILLRDYENASQPQPLIDLYIEYSPTQEEAGMIRSEETEFLPGWVVTSQEIVQVARPDGSSFRASRDVVSKAGERELVLYWYQAHGRAMATENWARYYLVADSIRMNRTDGALVRLRTPISSGESPDASQARLMNFGSHLLPVLDQYIPK